MIFRCAKCYRTEEYDFHEEAMEAGWKVDIERRWVCPDDTLDDSKSLSVH